MIDVSPVILRSSGHGYCAGLAVRGYSSERLRGGKANVLIKSAGLARRKADSHKVIRVADKIFSCIVYAVKGICERGDGVIYVEYPAVVFNLGGRVVDIVDVYISYRLVVAVKALIAL